MRIAYAGAEGAFAHEACLTFAPECEPIAVADFEAVVSAVGAGAAERGMVPLQNSRAGEVPDVLNLLATANVSIVERHALPVRMHLLGLAGARLEDLTSVTSHPVALRQCAHSVARLPVTTEPACNTALAARGLRDPTVAVLASEAAASAYGLTILQRDMQDDPNNTTIFALIEQRVS